MIDAKIDAGSLGVVEEHRKDVARGAIAEELAESFFVIRDAMPLDHRDEIALSVAAERGLAEVRIGGKESIGCDFEIGEIAAATAGDENFRAGLVVVLEQQYAAAAPSRRKGTHQA